MTCEPLSRLTHDTQHPDILRQIKERQDAYNLEHPAPEPRPEVPRPEPTRIQPGRTGVRRAADVAHLTYACMLCERKAIALQALAPDPLPGVGVP